MFRWVGEAFGPRWGFAAIYYQWQAIVIWFPTVLIYGAAALAYIWWPQSFDKALANNKLYTIVVLLAVYWFVTIFTFRGIGASSALSSLGGLFGTIIPGAILIVLGGVYVAMGKPIQMPLHTGFLPDFGDFHNMVLAPGVFLYYAGMEMQAVHVKNLKNPSRNYPLSVLIATVMVVVIFVLGTLAVGVVIPQKAIDLNQSLLVAYRDLWAALGLPWLGNVMAADVGVRRARTGQRHRRGPLHRAVGRRQGRLPAAYPAEDQCAWHSRDHPAAAGRLSSRFVLAFTVLPSVQSAYQILSQMATIIYLVMYLIMYVAAIRLRYTQPNKLRPFRIPGGNLGMWLVGMVGLVGAWSPWPSASSRPSRSAPAAPSSMSASCWSGAPSFAPSPSSSTHFTSRAGRLPDSDFEPFEGQSGTLAVSPVTRVARPLRRRGARCSRFRRL